jgi:hypothetical protein
MQENLKSNDPGVNPSRDGGNSYWNKWYIGVLLFLVIQILLFYWITKHFS